MRVQVLAVLPAQEPLMESAVAALERRPVTIPLSAAAIPPALELDLSFPAVPVGSGIAREMSLESTRPYASKGFVVRGSIEVDSLERVPANLQGLPLFADPAIAPFVGGGNPPFSDPAIAPFAGAAAPHIGTMADVRTKLDVAALHGRGLDGTNVAIAVMDTGINLAHLKRKLGVQPLFDAFNSWTPPGIAIAPGAHPIDHGTMCAFDALIAAPRATLLDFPILATSAAGGAVTGSTLSVAMQAFQQLWTSWAVAFAPGGVHRFGALVINNSWGIYHPSWDFPPGHPGRYVDNPDHPFNGLVGLLTKSGIDIVFAAGNCGSPGPDGRCVGRTTGSIMGANASPDVLTLAGCDTNDVRVPYSSQGPSIAGMFQNKPDITAYTHFLGSEAFGAGSPDTGTSTACPVAAGCVAAIRTRLSRTTFPPPNLFAQLKSTARKVGGATGWNGDYGHGIIDPDATATSFGL